MLWKVTDDWMDKQIKAKGISMERRRDFVLQMREWILRRFEP